MVQWICLRLLRRRFRIPNSTTLLFDLYSKHYCGCGSVGKAVASNSRGPWFESRHRQKINEHSLLSTALKRRKIKKKRPGIAPFRKLLFICH